jgi:K+-transporting ATPase ATPase C chain
MFANMRLFANLRPAFGISLIFFILLGLAYPLAETGIGQALFSHQANGSISADGSALIGQNWKGPQWFQGRPDADNPMATGGTNLGPRSKALVQATNQQITKLKKEGITPTPDLVTTSGSGVDPDISPAAAYAQVNAVAHARGLSVATVRHLVAEQVHQPQFGFLGSAYVNVLQLNQALAATR